jgi:competence ComEA-like helix-hairpin-helix protein
MPRTHLQPWTASQHRVLIALLLGIACYCGIRYAFNRRYVSDPQPITPDRAQELADRIDPNTADAASLAALPMIGEKRARDIIAYRERYTSDHPGERAFTNIQDLLRIRGVGASVIEQLRPYLIFDPAAAPESAESPAR